MLVPKGELRLALLKECHDGPVAEHRGVHEANSGVVGEELLLAKLAGQCRAIRKVLCNLPAK